MSSTTETIVREDAPKVQIRRLDESDPLVLYCHYRGQTGPQPAYIRLDLDSGELYAGYNPEIGPGIPERVWNGCVQGWDIPALRADAANALMERIVPTAQQILAHSETEWDGSNWRGRLDETALDCVHEIEHTIDTIEVEHVDEIIQVWEAADYYAPLGGQDAQRRETGITSATTDEQLAKIAAVELAHSDADVIKGLDEHLTRLRDEADMDEDEA